MPTPIGPEASWICPSLNATQTGAPVELLHNRLLISPSGTNVWTADTDKGGSWSCTGATNKYQSEAILGLTSNTDPASYVGWGVWIKNPAGAFAANAAAERVSGFDGSNQIYQDVTYNQVGTGGSWTQSKMTFDTLALTGSTFLGTGLIVRGIASAGWTEASWNALFDGQWMHVYTEVDYTRGNAGSIGDEQPISTDSYIRIYLNGIPMNTATVTMDSKIVYLANGSSFGAGSPTASITFPSTDRFWVDPDMVYDDLRVFGNTAPTELEIVDMASARAFEPAVSTPTPLGIETGWICPSLNPTQTGNPVDLIDGAPITSATTGTVWTADTDFGGAYSVTNEGSSRAMPSLLGDPTVAQERWGISIWHKMDAGTTDNLQVPSWRRMVNNGNGQDLFGVRYGFREIVLNGSIVTMSLELDIEFVVSSGTQGAICQLDLTYNSPTHTKAQWDALWNDQWHHWYFEVDMDRGSNGAGTNYNPFATDPWWKVYFDGVYIGNATAGGFDNNTASGFGGGTPSSYLWPASNVSNQVVDTFDDVRYFAQVTPTDAQIVELASARGYQPAAGPVLPVGLGDETLWLCPSLDDSANDISGNGNNGTYVGGMGTITDVSNGGSLCYDFDGIDDYIDVNNSINFGAVSVSLWVYSDDIARRFREFDSYDTIRGTSSPDIAIQHENGSGQRVFTQISGNQDTPYVVIQQSQWYHLCTVADGTNLSLYIDGSLASSVTSTTTPQSNLAIIGGRYSSTAEYLDGKMDDIRAYNRVLTQTEITHLATSRGIEGSPSTPPSGVFFNPFKSHAFHNRFFGNDRS